jgi:hypothetical protein
MNLDLKKSIYLLLIILGGVLILSFANLDPQAADNLNGEESSATAAPNETTLTTPDPSLSNTEPAPTDTETVLTTAEPVVTTAEPVVTTAEPEITSQLITGNAGEPGRDQESDIEGYGNRSDGSQDRQTQAGVGECDWELTFEDNFEGDDLDTKLWDTGYKAGDHEAQYYVDDAFELEDGILKIRAEERQVRDREYTSGILTTQDIFDQRYGRFTIRAKVPVGQGLWPAFWLLPSSENYPLEIDVFEILGHEPDTVYMTNHWRDEDSGKSTFHTRGFQGPDFSQEFHIFEIIWRPGEIVWFVNGVERARETRGVPDEPMFLLLNLAVGGKWPGYPDDSTPFPSYLEVDYVRVYEWTCLEDAGE